MPLPHPPIGDEKMGFWLEASFVHIQVFEPLEERVNSKMDQLHTLGGEMLT